MVEMAVDSLDKELIRLLQEDAGQSSYALAKKLNVSSSTVRRRIRALGKNGVIHATVSIDYGTIGLPLAAHIALNVDPEELNSVWQALTNLPHVKHVSITAGRYDILGLVRVSSTDELLRFVQSEVTQIKGVNKCETFICLRMERTL